MKPPAVATKDLLIVTDDTAFGIALVVVLKSAHLRIMIDSWPLSTLADAAPPDAAIVELDGRETVVGLRELLDRWPRARFLFAVREMPLSATLARIVRHHGGVILGKDESPMVFASTLVAMLASDQGARP